MSHVSHHRGKDGRLSHVERRFHDAHIAAGYHEREWGPHARRTSPVLGEHESGHKVELLREGPTGGPEFLVTLPSGAQVTVLCEDIVAEYLAQA